MVGQREPGHNHERHDRRRQHEQHRHEDQLRRLEVAGAGLELEVAHHRDGEDEEGDVEDVDVALAVGCPEVPTVQPFAAWQDFADYLLAPDGDFEAGASSWLLEGGASAGEGNDPLPVGDPSDHRTLRLPAGATATTAPMCIGVEHRTMRFLGTSATSGTLLVEALYSKRDGPPKSITLGAVRGTGDWAPSDVLPMRVNELAAGSGNAMSVSLRFSARGNAAWEIDDVYVDPYRTK